MSERIGATKLLVKELPKKEEVRASGLIVPNQVKGEPSALSVVVMTGKGTAALPMDVNVGDKVLHSPHAILKVVIPDREETKDLPFSGELGLLDLKDALLVF